MSIEIREPTKMYLTDVDPATTDRIRRELTYLDKRIDFQLKKAKRSHYLQHQLGEEGFAEHIADLQAKRTVSLLNESEGDLWALSGLAGRVGRFLRQDPVQLYALPTPKPLPWFRKPDRVARPYQKSSIEKLIAVGHGGVSLATGSGKSFCILNGVREVGLQTVVMCPSRSIARQLYREFTHHLGTKYVGLYGDGKKELGRRITVAIDDSLVKVREGTPAWEWFTNTDVFVADESHLTPASTLQHVCLGLMARAAYRWFFSATQFRKDGLGLVLEGIVGPIVETLTVREGVDQGYLARPFFTMVRVDSASNFQSSDVNKMTQHHLLRNDLVYDKAAAMINRAVKLLGAPTLVLVDEVDQFQPLLQRLKIAAQFAHGPLTPKNRETVPKDHWNSDPDALVAGFDKGDYPVLVGTTCISTGTDLKTPRMLFRIKGGASEIEVHQDTGRGTRLSSGKDCVHVVDFDVVNVPEVHRHAIKRAAIYEDIYPGLRWQ